MKYLKILFYIILIFINLLGCSKKGFLDTENESKLENFTNTYFKVIGDINNNKTNIHKLSEYLNQIDDSLIGYSIVDGMLKHIFPDKNNALIKLLENNLNNNKLNNYQKNEIKYVLDKRKLFSKFSSSSFSLSTVLYRFDLFSCFTIILPNANWKKLYIKDNSIISYIAGDDGNSCSISLKILNISDFKLNDFNKNKGKVYYNNILKNKMKYAKKDKLIKIGESMLIGKHKFNNIYQQFEYSDFQNNSQEFISITRLFSNEEKVYEINISNFIAGDNIITDKERLKKTK